MFVVKRAFPSGNKHYQEGALIDPADVATADLFQRYIDLGYVAPTGTPEAPPAGVTAGDEHNQA